MADMTPEDDNDDNNMLATPAEVQKRLKSVSDYVKDCERRVSLGEIMELQGLDKNVIDLCDAIAELEPADARDLEVQMGSLIGNLEVLARAMKEQQDKIDKAEKANKKV